MLNSLQNNTNHRTVYMNLSVKTTYALAVTEYITGVN